MTSKTDGGMWTRTQQMWHHLPKSQMIELLIRWWACSIPGPWLN